MSQQLHSADFSILLELQQLQAKRPERFAAVLRSHLEIGSTPRFDARSAAKTDDEAIDMRKRLDAALDSLMLAQVTLMLSPSGPGERIPGDALSTNMAQLNWSIPLWSRLLCGALTLIFSWRFDLNTFSLTSFYRIRLARCYLGASRWMPGERHPNRFTNFDPQDDLSLSSLRYEKFAYAGLFPIFNCALNLGGSTDLSVCTRHSASFSMTPLRCGCDRGLIGYGATGDVRDQGMDEGVVVGQAMAISGAAASPNMGYNTSPLVAFLLTMFNVRLGWWFPNPGLRPKHWRPFNLWFLMKELFGMAGEHNPVVNLSDGGHFENLGIYELVCRRCRVIIACDAECDDNLTFGSLGNVIRICETDFGARIQIDVGSIRLQDNGFSQAHGTAGTITYRDGSIGYLIYIKSSLTGDEPVGVAQYHAGHPDFPHQTTADQFFSEDQFDSYRQLSEHIMAHILRGTLPGADLLKVAEDLFDRTAPATNTEKLFSQHAAALNGIWERCRSAKAGMLEYELVHDEPPTSGTKGESATDTAQGDDYLLGLQVLQLMENVYLDLNLEDFWEHANHRGWALLFMRWARSARLREVYMHSQQTFGIRFVDFCNRRLGLPCVRPPMRVPLEEWREALDVSQEQKARGKLMLLP